MRELTLLQHIYAGSAELGADVLVGPGDDMAVLRVGGQTLLLTVDQVADGVHFDSRHTSIERIARKAIVRSLSDVAAMAASPVAALASAMLPQHFTQAQGETLVDAMRRTGRLYNCPLVGGDVAIWDGALQLSVTILAEPAGLEPVLRRGARPGDAVFVTGELGNAWAPAGEADPHAWDGEPRIDLARDLRTRLGTDLHSMIDLSDGLGSDLTRIAEQSSLAARVHLPSLPLRPARRDRPDLRAPWEAALCDGEDYELCFTVAPEAADRLPPRLRDVPLTRVARILAPADACQRRPGAVDLEFSDGRVEPLSSTGWEHRS